MGGYIARRLVALVPVLLLVSATVFTIIRASQGDPSLLMVGQEGDPALAARLREELGFNRPIPVQYLDWLGHVLRGDLGRSLRLPYSVDELIINTSGPTLELAVGAVVLSLVVAVPLGTFGALRAGSFAETLVTAVSAMGAAMPNFWLGVLLILLFSLGLRWLPSSGFVSPQQDLLGNLRLLLLPVVTLSFANVALFTRVVHASMAEILFQEYVRTAQAKGLPNAWVLGRHALRNALLPLVTALGVHFSRLLGGAVVVETIFGIPGLGRLMVESITGRDFTVVQGLVLYLTAVTVLSSLIVDVVYVYLDPRLRMT